MALKFVVNLFIIVFNVGIQVTQCMFPFVVTAYLNSEQLILFFKLQSAHNACKTKVNRVLQASVSLFGR